MTGRGSLMRRRIRRGSTASSPIPTILGNAQSHLGWTRKSSATGSVVLGMITIDAFQPSDLTTLIRFVEAIQEHERIDVPDLKSGTEIGSDYAQMLIRTASKKNGCIRMARAETVTVGFGCAWIEEDDDPCLSIDAQIYGYVSDLFVEGVWRRRGVALRLLEVLEREMRGRGCGRMRICSKAANHLALACYKRAGYQPYEIVLTKRIDV
jgi:ribosomal protein S18 acetylase RimI-like enzyme